MRHLRIASAFALTLAGSDVLAQSATPALDAAAAAMGGKEHVLAIRTLILEGTGESLTFGQNHTPYAETQHAITAYRRSYDFVNRRWFVDQTREPRFVTANVAPQRVRLGVDGYPNTVAYNINNAGTMLRAGGSAATDRLSEFLYHPVGFLMAAFASGTPVTEHAGPEGDRTIRITVAGMDAAMVVDGRTNLPSRVERAVSHPMLGDITLVTDFSDWRATGDLRLPMRLRQRYGDLFTLSDLRLTAARVNDEVGNLAATDSIRTVAQAGQPAGQPAGPAPRIVVDSVAPGVWSIAGQSHHTIAIEQSNQIVLVEAPQSDARARAAIAAARELRPGKALSLLVNTHHHFDHAGGIRAAASQGLTIVTHASNRDFYERVVLPPARTREGDALSERGGTPRVRAVGDREVLRDRMRTIELHHIPNPHSGSMLVVYLPAERLLIQADLYNPPPENATNVPVFPFVKALVDEVGRRGLRVERVVGIHGRVVPWSDLEAAASRAP